MTRGTSPQKVGIKTHHFELRGLPPLYRTVKSQYFTNTLRPHQRCEQDAARSHQSRDQQAPGPAAHPRLRQAEALPAPADGAHPGLCQKNKLF